MHDHAGDEALCAAEGNLPVPRSWGHAVDILQTQRCAVLAVLETWLLLHIDMQVHPLTGLQTSKAAVSARMSLVCTPDRTPLPCCSCQAAAPARLLPVPPHEATSASKSP